MRDVLVVDGAVVTLPSMDNPAVAITVRAVLLLEAAPGSFSTTTNAAYVGCPGCRESVYEHQIPKHAARCAPLRALASSPSPDR